MKEKSTDKSGTVLTVALAVVAVLLIVILVLTQSMLDNRSKQAEIPEPVVLEFLTKYVPLQSLVEQEAVIEEYFSCVDMSSLRYDGCSQDLLNINAVLVESESTTVVGFRVCSSKKNYIEFMLLDADGNDRPCRIGMFYQLGGDGRISSYNIFRLQPVSRRDPEWNGAWL